MNSLIHNLLLAVLLVVGASSRNYEGYKIYQVIPKTEAQASFIHKLHHDPNFDVFKNTRILGKPSTVMVSPEGQWYFEQTLEKLTQAGLEYKIVVDNVQEKLDKQAAERKQSRSSSTDSQDIFDRYLTHDEVLEYLHSLEKEYPDNVRLESIGSSYEGRDLLLIHIEQGHDTNRPTIFIDAGIHAREWIATPTALYVINQLVENSTNVGLIEKVNWAILPSVNPDGYEYSRAKDGDSYWRKTRSVNANSSCLGTDANRNFGFHWMESGLVSPYPCDEIYAGSEAFSENETTAIEKYLLSNGKNVKLYLTLHSSGEYILYPWGYTPDLPDDADELQALGEAVADAIAKVANISQEYTVGSSTNVLYEAAGGSDDWAKGVAGVNLSYTIELPGGDWGFDPPENAIRQIVTETFEGFREFASYIEKKFT